MDRISNILIALALSCGVVLTVEHMANPAKNGWPLVALATLTLAMWLIGRVKYRAHIRAFAKAAGIVVAPFAVVGSVLFILVAWCAYHMTSFMVVYGAVVGGLLIWYSYRTITSKY